MQYYLFLASLKKVSRRFKLYDVAIAFSSLFTIISPQLTLSQRTKGDPNTPVCSSGTTVNPEYLAPPNVHPSLALKYVGGPSIRDFSVLQQFCREPLALTDSTPLKYLK